MEDNGDFEIIKHRGRRYRRLSGGSNTSLPPVMPKSRDSCSAVSFQHQKYRPLPSIGSRSTTYLDSTELSRDDRFPHPPQHTISCDNWKDALLPEPEPSDPYTVMIKVKLSNSHTVQRRFKFTRDQLYHVVIFAHFSTLTEPINFDLVTLTDNSVPKNNYLDFFIRLDKIGLTHNTLLHYSYNS